MKVLIEEYGVLIVSAIIGMIVIGIGLGMFIGIEPFIDAYINSLM